MRWIEIIPIFIGSGGLLGLAFIFFRMGRFAQKVDNLSAEMDRRFDAVHERCDKIDNKLNKIESDIHDIKENTKDIEIQLGILETRVEERTMRPNYGETVGR